MSELRRRNVFRMAVLYIVAAWLVMQVAEVVIDLANLPESIGPIILLLLAIGFPIALIFSWFYELTPDGIESEKDVSPSDSAKQVARRRTDIIVIALLCAAVILFAYDKWWPDQVPDKSVAVLAFANLSGDPDQDYFSDGISEEVLNLLSRVEGLKVAARTSTFVFKNHDADITRIGEALGVAAVLEGSVRRDGDRVRITAQLIDARNGYHLWSNNFDRELDDVFGVQSEIANAIVDVLKVELLGEEALAVQDIPIMDAYDLHLLGRFHMHQRTPESLPKAVDLFEQVVEIEPEYAPGWSGLADSLYLMEEYVGSSDRAASRRQILEAARQAVKLDPGLAEGHASFALAHWDEDSEQVERSLRRAIELKPGYSMAYMWLGEVLRSRLRRPYEALASYRVAAELDPLHPTVQANVAEALLALGEPQEAGAHLLRAIEFNPDSDILIRNLSLVAERQARLDESHHWAARGVATNPTSPLALYRLGMVNLMLGRIEAAESWHARLVEQVPNYPMADFMKAWILFGAGRYIELDELSSQRAPWMRSTVKLLIGESAESLAMLEEMDWDRFSVGPKSVLYSQLGYAYRQLGRGDESSQAARDGLAWLDEHANAGFAQPWVPYERAMLLALLDENDAAVDSLYEAYDVGWRDYFRYGVWIALLDNMMDDNIRYAEFKEMLLKDIARMREQVEGTELSGSDTDS